MLDGGKEAGRELEEWPDALILGHLFNDVSKPWVSKWILYVNWKISEHRSNISMVWIGSFGRYIRSLLKNRVLTMLQIDVQ